MQPHMRAWIDQEDARIRDTVRKFGWAIEYVGGGDCSAPSCDGGANEEPAFGYTVGLFDMGHDELLVFGLDGHDTMGVLNTLGQLIREGETLIPGHVLTVGDWPHRVIPEEVPNPGDIVFTANRFYQRPDEVSVGVLQLSYDDDEGRFPWDEGFANPRSQPRPGAFSAWVD